jgi:hypothetical protein
MSSVENKEVSFIYPYPLKVDLSKSTASFTWSDMKKFLQDNPNISSFLLYDERGDFLPLQTAPIRDFLFPVEASV